ncbi:MAG: hypothetical protein ACLTBV_11825 [Enterocloster bolteae]
MPFDPEKGPGYIDRTLKAIDSLALSEEEKRQFFSEMQNESFTYK